MIKTRKDSKIEVWGITYINNPHKRIASDMNKEIVQIEPVTNGNYIVEVIEGGAKI